MPNQSKAKNTLAGLFDVIKDRKNADPKNSYVASLFDKGTDVILKKVGEESAEVIIAAKNGDQNEIVKEMADLVFHSLVLLAHMELTPEQIEEELKNRFGVSGLIEKTNRQKEQP